MKRPLPESIRECEAAIKKANAEYDDAADRKDEAARDMEEADEWIDKLTAHMTNLKNSALEPDIIDRLRHFVTTRHGGMDMAILEAVMEGEVLSHSQALRLKQLRTMYLI
jgi:hypothetical protein